MRDLPRIMISEQMPNTPICLRDLCRDLIARLPSLSSAPELDGAKQVHQTSCFEQCDLRDWSLSFDISRRSCCCISDGSCSVKI